MRMMRVVLLWSQGLVKGSAPSAAQMAALSRKAAEAQLQLTDSRRDAAEVTRYSCSLSNPVYHLNVAKVALICIGLCQCPTMSEGLMCMRRCYCLSTGSVASQVHDQEAGRGREDCSSHV